MSRTYEKTHPWLTFSLDTNEFDHRLWMLLGEAGSKCDHIAGVPLAPEIADQMHRLYLAKGAAATTAIEGNTLSEEEAERILSGDLTLPPSQQYLADELTNIVGAVNLLAKELNENRASPITIEMLKAINALVLDGLQVDPEVIPGEIRKHNVVVGRYRCAPAEDCEYLLQKLCDMLNNFPVPADSKQGFSIIKAVFAHLYFVWIHPFGDGNGRTARLLELYILLSAGFAQPTGHLLSNHYNRTRQQYYSYLNNAINGQKGVIDFIRYSVAGLVDGLKEQIGVIRLQQWRVSWINFVHEQFHEKNTPADTRRRHLVLALSDIPEGVQLNRLTTLTPILAQEYFGKTAKTAARDVNALEEMELVARGKGRVRARKEKILAFLPWRSDEENMKTVPPTDSKADR
jgi:Uncharacterized conserved protein